MFCDLELFCIEEMLSYCIMGRGRRGPTDQSQKKVKKNSYTRNATMIVGKPESCEDGGIYYLSEQMIAEMKSLNPRDVARALLSDDVKASGN